MTNNSKTKAKITTPNITIPIPIELLQFLLKKGQYIVPNNIVDQYAHVWLYSSVQYCTLWYCNVLYGTVLYSTVQYIH